MNGILLIDKPAGWSSFDVVAKVRGIIRNASSREHPKNSQSKPAKIKVGHTGTLDPLATGLLVLVVGDYCKRATEFSKLDKVYHVTMCLGTVSATGDEEGQKTFISEVQPSRADIDHSFEAFTGSLMQIPPAFSAVKVKGQRAYKLARTGVPVVLEARPVTVHRLHLISYDYPNVIFNAAVSSGTYIRSLVEDMGTNLKTGAYMSGLRRIAVGRWDVTEALEVDGLTAEMIYQRLLKP